MQAGSGAKNPPWARSSVNSNITGMNPQIMDPNSMISQQGMMSFQQTPTVFNNMMQAQGGMAAMSMTGQMPMNQMAQGQMYPGNVVAYPTPRALNPGIYQNAQNNQAQQNTEQRVFTGTVTKTHNDFGFVDHDVFYQTSVCAKGIIPKINDRVLVEATFNPNMPFKWNATRVQVLPKNNPNQKSNTPKSNTYNAVPPPANAKKQMPSRRDERIERRDPPRREERKRSRTRSRSRSKDRRDSRSRRDSPPRKRPTVHQPSPVKHVVRVPRMPLDIQKMDVPGLSQRYTNLYIPSDFFNAHVKWGETFPPQMPFSLANPCTYHIMSREAENPLPNEAVLEPPDADYRFSAKVMLISLPTMETLYQKCGITKSDDKEKRGNKTPQHPTRLIKFLVGQKIKSGENFAIGGPWSPSLDGENPESDPSVLVRTAIRTCKALTGVDLSCCTQWYRMVEFYYWRESGGKSRLECVVLFLPDVWSAQPSRVDWNSVQQRYSAGAEAAAARLTSPAAPAADPAVPTETQPTQPPSGTTAEDDSQIENSDANNTTITIDENDDEEEKLVPTHYSDLDLKTIKVEQLRQELKARKVNCKGVRATLVSRLSKLLKAEEEKENEKTDDVMEVEDDDAEKEPEKPEETPKESKELQPAVEENSKQEPEKKEKTEKEIEEEQKKLEKQIAQIKTRYELPSEPHIIVHPNPTAKAGKFGCSVATLSLLLDYRMSDNKEHSFELFVFAELFNEMLMRDFGFYTYKTLYTLPEKVDESKDKDKEKSADKDKKEEQSEKEKSDKDKRDDKSKDDKKDDKRESSRKRERRDSQSEERNSPAVSSRIELPPDPFLLLSLVYFDTTRGGVMSRKELHSLFMSLGLQLSRSQLRGVLDKVCVRDAFNYKSLMNAMKDLGTGKNEILQDLPLDSLSTSAEVPPHIAELESVIAAGNRNLLPLFKQPSADEAKDGETKDISDTGVVVYKSRVVDVGALVAMEARGLAVRGALERAVAAARSELGAARAAAAEAARTQRAASAHAAQLTDALHRANNRVAALQASSKIFHSALKSIQSKVEAVININYEDDDVVEVVNGPSRAEKDKDTKDVKNSKDTKDIKDSKDTKEIKDAKDIKDVKDSKDVRDSKETKDIKDVKDIKDTKDMNKSKSEGKEVKPTVLDLSEEVKNEKKTQNDCGKPTESKEKDIIATENMDLDDKE